MSSDSDLLPPAGDTEPQSPQQPGRFGPLFRALACCAALAVIALAIAILHNRLGNHARSGGLGALDSRVPIADQPAPDFVLSDIQGRRVRLSDLHGQIVLVNFWATWCGPCRAELPDIDAVYRAEKDDGFTVLEVNEQESQADVAAFVEQIGQMPPVVLDNDGSVMAQYRLKGLPDSFVVDRQGIVRGMSFGPMSHQTILKLVDGARAAR